MAEAYQPLFDLMATNFDKVLTVGEMNDIIAAVDNVNENLTELYREVCDVEGCNKDASSQGTHWRDKGYWCICYIHSQDGREGKQCPQMKKEAIEREASRLPDGCLPT